MHFYVRCQNIAVLPRDGCTLMGFRVGMKTLLPFAHIIIIVIELGRRWQTFYTNWLQFLRVGVGVGVGGSKLKSFTLVECYAAQGSTGDNFVLLIIDTGTSLSLALILWKKLVWWQKKSTILICCILCLTLYALLKIIM